MIWLLLCALAFGSDDVITLKKGETAPFDGTLLSPESAAKLLVIGETDLAVCLADSQKKLDIQAAEATYELQTAEAKLARCTFEAAKKEELYLSRINWLEKKVSPPSWRAPVYFGTGVAVGVGVIVLSTWTLDQIQEN